MHGIVLKSWSCGKQGKKLAETKDFDIPKTSWIKFRHMVNIPFWHISDFVLASYNFGCVKMSDFVPNNRHLREVLIFFFHSKKTAAEATKSLRRCWSKWNNVPWLVPSLRRWWFRCWRPSAWRKDKNLRRRWILISDSAHKTLLIILITFFRLERNEEWSKFTILLEMLLQ